MQLEQEVGGFASYVPQEEGREEEEDQDEEEPNERERNTVGGKKAAADLTAFQMNFEELLL